MGKPCTGLNLPCSNYHKGPQGKAVETVNCPRCDCTCNYCEQCIPKFHHTKVCHACAEQKHIRDNVKEEDDRDWNNRQDPADEENPEEPDDPMDEGDDADAHEEE